MVKSFDLEGEITTNGREDYLREPEIQKESDVELGSNHDYTHTGWVVLVLIPHVLVLSAHGGSLQNN